MAVYRIHGKGVWSGQGTIKNLESNVRTAIAMADFFKGRFKVIDDYAFVQTRNLYKQLMSGATANRKLAAEFAGALAFKLKGKSAFAHRLKYIYHWATGKMYK